MVGNSRSNHRLQSCQSRVGLQAASLLRTQRFVHELQVRVLVNLEKLRCEEGQPKRRRGKPCGPYSVVGPELVIEVTCECRHKQPLLRILTLSTYLRPQVEFTPSMIGFFGIHGIEPPRATTNPHVTVAGFILSMIQSAYAAFQCSFNIPPSCIEPTLFPQRQAENAHCCLIVRIQRSVPIYSRSVVRYFIA